MYKLTTAIVWRILGLSDIFQTATSKNKIIGQTYTEHFRNTHNDPENRYKDFLGISLRKFCNKSKGDLLSSYIKNCYKSHQYKLLASDIILNTYYQDLEFFKRKLLCLKNWISGDIISKFIIALSSGAISAVAVLLFHY